MNTPIRPARILRVIAISALCFAWVLCASASAPAADEMPIFSGFAILENQAAVAVNEGAAGAEIQRELVVVDPTGRAWSAAVVEDRIELKPGKTANAGSKSFSPKSIGVLKLKSGQKYAVRLSPAESKAVPAKQDERPNRPAPSYAMLIEPGKSEASSMLAKLTAGFETAATDTRHETIRTNAQGANFVPPASRRAWESRKAELREQLLVTQGLWPMWPKTPLEPKTYGIMDRGDYTIEKVALETLPGFYLSGNVYRPKAAEGKLPAILSPHGHYADGRMNPDVQARCIRLAKLGFLVFMYDMVGYNDSKPFGHSFTNDKMDRFGLNLVGFQTFNSIRALDWVQSLEEVDPARIGCTGESGGGTQTFFLCAVDDRIAAAAPVVMISEGFQGGCVCENAAGMRLGTDNVEIGAMFAPKPMRIVGATGDWTANTMTIVHPKLREVYGLYGRPGLVTATIFNFEHNYNRVSRNAVYPFFAKWLRNVPETDDLREPELQYESAETLMVMTDAKPFETKTKSREEIESHLIEMRSKQVGEWLFLASLNAAEREAAKRSLQVALKIRTGVDEPAANDLSTTEIDADLFEEGVQMRKLTVGRIGAGEAVPTLELKPNRSSGVSVVLATGKGIAGILGENGKPIPLVRKLLSRGATVYAFDPLLEGTSFDPTAGRTARPSAAHYACYNKSMTQDRLQDLANVVALAKSRSDCRQVHLAGVSGGGESALWARPSLTGIGRTYIDLEGADDPLGTLVLAGAAQAGGLRGAAQAIAPGILKIERTGPNGVPADFMTRCYELEGVASNVSVTDTSKPSSSGESIADWLLEGN
jgi:dienelactone hydrolase